MPKVPFPNKNPDAWDTVRLNGVASPGVCKVSVTASNKLDVQDASSQHGASVVHNGRSPARISLNIIVWDDEDGFTTDWDRLLDFITFIYPPSTKLDAANSALLIDHPQTDLLGIERVVVDNIKVDPPPEGGDRYSVNIELVEFLAKKDDGAKAVAKRLKPRAQQLADVVPSAIKPSTGNTGP